MATSAAMLPEWTSIAVGNSHQRYFILRWQRYEEGFRTLQSEGVWRQCSTSTATARSTIYSATPASITPIPAASCPI